MDPGGRLLYRKDEGACRAFQRLQKRVSSWVLVSSVNLMGASLYFLGYWAEKVLSLFYRLLL